MKSLDVTAPGKLLAALMVIVGCFAFLMLRDGESIPAWTTLGIVVGYLFGNGVGARRGQDTVAPFSPSHYDPNYDGRSFNGRA